MLNIANRMIDATSWRSIKEVFRSLAQCESATQRVFCHYSLDGDVVLNMAGVCYGRRKERKELERKELERHQEKAERWI